MPTTLTNGIQLPDKGSVDWYSSMQSNYNLIDTHLGDTDVHVTAEDKANWNSKQGSLSQAQLDAIAQVATNTDDIATLQSGKADASHTHSSSDITDIDDYATKDYVDNSISGLVDNAPDALNTLNELSAALNDDSNFASTVTTALAAKADSADLATVATSGSYNDLDDLPTIPTNTSDLTNDSDFVVSSNLATVATSGDYDDLSNKPSIPTNTSDLNNDSGFVTLNDFDIPSKTSDLTNDSGFITSSDVPTSTSDLTNDSNFVDTSNPAVSSGITSAKVTDYDTHIADTDIHVTTADKNKWNNQTYVFRYSSTALVASSTNSNALLDNTDNLKVGDKVIDSSGVLFSITAIDTANSTFTIGTALIDLAQDSDVMHLSGNETASGNKNFSDDVSVKILTATGKYISDEGSTNRRTVLKLLAGARDTDGYSCSYVTRVRTNKAQGALISSDVQTLGFDFVENQVRTLNTFIIRATNWLNDIPQKIEFTSNIADYTYGSSANKAKINDLEPSSLSLPDLSNGIDISSYITIGSTDNNYTPPANGWIWIRLIGNGAGITQGDFGINANYVSDNITQEKWVEGCLLVTKDVQAIIRCRGITGIVGAKFYPCLGNV